MRLFLLYAVVEVAVVVALVSTVGLGWTLLISLATFVLGLVLAGSQLKRQLRRLRSGLTATTAPGRSPTAHWLRWAPCWSYCPASPVRSPVRYCCCRRHGWLPVRSSRHWRRVASGAGCRSS